jgi:hypothetical protein
MNANEREKRQTADERGCTQIMGRKLAGETLEIHVCKSAIRFIPFVFASIRVNSRLIFFGKCVAAALAGKPQKEYECS